MTCLATCNNNQIQLQKVTRLTTQLEVQLRTHTCVTHAHFTQWNVCDSSCLTVSLFLLFAYLSLPSLPPSHDSMHMLCHKTEWLQYFPVTQRHPHIPTPVRQLTEHWSLHVIELSCLDQKYKCTMQRTDTTCTKYKNYNTNRFVYKHNSWKFQ